MNEFLPFAEAENANLIPFSEWQNAAARLSGFSSGIARSNQINRAIAQGANISYAIAKFIERTLKEDVYVSQPDLLVDQFYRAMLEMSYRAAWEWDAERLWMPLTFTAVSRAMPFAVLGL